MLAAEAWGGQGQGRGRQGNGGVMALTVHIGSIGVIGGNKLFCTRCKAIAFCRLITLLRWPFVSVILGATEKFIQIFLEPWAYCYLVLNCSIGLNDSDRSYK